MKSGHSVVLLPRASRYQLEQPDAHTVPGIISWISSLYAATTSGRTSTVAT